MNGHRKSLKAAPPPHRQVTETMDNYDLNSAVDIVTAVADYLRKSAAVRDSFRRCRTLFSDRNRTKGHSARK